MKKIMNNPFNFVDEMMEGILAAHGDKIQAIDGDLRAIKHVDPSKVEKVAIATGGGSGHLPVFLGYVGSGMVDGCSIGNVFSSPPAAR